MKTYKYKNLLPYFIGNVLEWYDFAIYGYLIGTIAILFFPLRDPTASLLIAYGTFAAGFIARPLGSIVFGHLGDRYGRAKTLQLSLLTMAIPTFLIGCLPIYENIGVLSSLLLVLCRICQGFSLGGEFSGSVVMLVEQGLLTPKPRNFRNSIK